MKMIRRIIKDIRGNPVSSVLLFVTSAFITMLLCFTDYMFVIYDRYESTMIYDLGNRIDLTWESGDGYSTDFLEKIENLENVQGYNFIENGFADITVEKQAKEGNKTHNDNYEGIAMISGNLNTALDDEFRRENYVLSEGELPNIHLRGIAVDREFADSHNISVGDIIKLKNEGSGHSVTQEVTGIYDIINPVYRMYPADDNLLDDQNYIFGEMPYPMIYLSYEESCELLAENQNRSQLWVYANRFMNTEKLCSNIKDLVSGENIVVDNSIQSTIDNFVAPMKIAYQIAVLLNTAFLIAGFILLLIMVKYWEEKHRRDYRVYYYLGMTGQDMQKQAVAQQLAIIGVGAAIAAVTGWQLIEHFGYNLANWYFDLSGAFWQYEGNYEQYFTGTGLTSQTGRIFLPYWLFPIGIGIIIVLANTRKKKLRGDMT
mgnify:CR=1 FL=1